MCLLRLDHPEGVATEYKQTAGRRLGDCDLKLDDLDPRLARMNLKDTNHEAMLRKIEEEREWTPWNICDGERERVLLHYSKCYYFSPLCFQLGQRKDITLPPEQLDWTHTELVSCGVEIHV